MKHPRGKLYCCEKCQLYWTCETKWYRGERGEENICCPLCNFYRVCVHEIVPAPKKLNPSTKLRVDGERNRTIKKKK